MFQTADGYINIAAAGDNLWKRFCEAAGATELLTDPRYNTPAGRQQHRAELLERVAAIVRRHPSDHWVEVLNKAEVPCGPINTIDKVFADPQVQHLGVAKPIDHPKYGPQKVVAQPIHLSGYPHPEKLGHTPEPGEHTDEILRSLGYDDSAIGALRAKRAV